MKRVLITGQSGFLGGHIGQRLMSDGYDVRALSADLLEYDRVADEVADVSPNFIVHLAARTEVAKSFGEPVSFSAINYVGTVNLVECCRRLTDFKLFAFASTMETYGWQPISDLVESQGMVAEASPFDELTPQNPNAPYAVAKVGCERYLEYAGRSYGLPWVALRQTNCYGRADNDFFVVERMITQMLRGAECRLGDPLPYRNFLFVSDLVELYRVVLAQHERAAGQVFCTGPPNAVSIRTLAEMAARATSYHGEVYWGTIPRRAGEIYYLNSTHEKVRRVLGWEPTVGLEEGLDRTVDLWRAKLASGPSVGVGTATPNA